MMDDFCDYCGLPNPVAFRGSEQMNVPCTHSEVGNREAAQEAQAPYRITLPRRR